MGEAVVANGARDGEGGEARDKAGACGERESVALEEAVNEANASRDGSGQPRVGREG